MSNIFALVEYGYYDEYGIEIVELDRGDKDMFELYCKESKEIDAIDNISIGAVAWMDNAEMVDGDWREIVTIDEVQARVEETIKMIRDMRENESSSGHYLADKEILLHGLLEYDFVGINRKGEANMKFEVGDRVRVIGSDVAWSCNIGKAGFVDYLEKDDREYGISLHDGNCDVAHEDDLEKIGVEIIKEVKPTKLYQLFEWYNTKENQDDVFTDSVKRVYSYNEGFIMSESDDDHADVTHIFNSNGIWNKDIEFCDEVVEMTFEDLQDELGYKVKIVGGC